MRVESREFGDKGFVILIAETEAEVDALHRLGHVGSVVAAEFEVAAPGEIFLRLPFVENAPDFFVDIFVGDSRKREVHHKNRGRAGCELSKLEAPVVFDSLTRARLQGYEPCGSCFNAEK